MSRRKIIHIDKRTGEELHGSLVWCHSKSKVFPHGYVALSQKGLYELLVTYQITNQQLLFLSRILKDIGFHNILPYTATQFAKIYGYSRTYASRIIRELYELGILVDYCEIGRSKYYALNSNLGWKGKPKEWFDNSSPDWAKDHIRQVYMLRKAQQEYQSDTLK